MDLIIVESPKKAMTIEKFLGGKYKVLGSGGHIRELPEKTFGVDVENNFEPTYVINAGSKKIVKELKDYSKKADLIYLATDPDREGEAIAWHLYDTLEIKGKSYRIRFNEISKGAIEEALAHPTTIDTNLVDSQQARRILDRIVGYRLSPYVRNRVEKAESAGRVQSVAVKLIVDLERKILAFVPKEYWTISAFVHKEGFKTEFKMLLVDKNGKKFRPEDDKSADEVYKYVLEHGLKVDDVKKGEVKSHALPPFTTSTMQQDASIKLGLSAPQVMQCAQHLYEGIETPNGHLALVTYIRTDSTRISQHAQQDAEKYIKANFGDEYYPAKPNIYSASKNAQDAHEAIRPIDINMTPDKVKSILDKNHFGLYKLIYERFLASQMSEAIYNSMTIHAVSGDYGFKATGKSVKFKGYTAVYDFVNNKNKDSDEGESENKVLPDITTSDNIIINKLEKEQKFTKPPVRYTDSSLVKAMEENGIGRPSTYATIIGTLVNRKYVKRVQKYLEPTDIAFKATDLLVENFSDIVDVGFTAKMETDLDEIAENGADWHKVVSEFYGPFMDKLKAAQIKGVPTDIPCPVCGELLEKRNGRFGEYHFCQKCGKAQSVIERELTDTPCPTCGKLLYKGQSKFGEYLYCDACKKYINDNDKESDILCPICGKNMTEKSGKFGKYLTCLLCNLTMQEGDVLTDEKCEKCGGRLLEKKGKFGKYYKCIKCGELKSQVEEVGTCPICHKPTTKRNSKTGKIFYGCSGYPECKFMSWDIPTGELCTVCGKPMVIDKKGQTVCSNKDCGKEKK